MILLLLTLTCLHSAVSVVSLVMMFPHIMFLVSSSPSTPIMPGALAVIPVSSMSCVPVPVASVFPVATVSIPGVPESQSLDVSPELLVRLTLAALQHVRPLRLVLGVPGLLQMFVNVVPAVKVLLHPTLPRPPVALAVLLVLPGSGPALPVPLSLPLTPVSSLGRHRLMAPAAPSSTPRQLQDGGRDLSECAGARAAGR